MKSMNWGRLAAVLVGLLLILSALGKLFPIQNFELGLMAQGFAGDRLTSGLFARFFVMAELSLGIALILDLGFARLAARLNLLMLGAFSIYLGILAFTQPDLEDCGCMGSIGAMGPLASLIKNLILMGMTGTFLYLSAPKPRSRQWLWLSPVFMYCLLLLAFPLQSGQAIPDSETMGKKMMALLSLECDHCKEAARLVKDLQQEQPELTVEFLYWGEEKLIEAFESETETNFDYRLLSTEEFFSMLEQSPPRLMYFENDSLRHNWEGESVDEAAIRDWFAKNG